MGIAPYPRAKALNKLDFSPVMGIALTMMDLAAAFIRFFPRNGDSSYHAVGVRKKVVIFPL